MRFVGRPLTDVLRGKTGSFLPLLIGVLVFAAVAGAAFLSKARSETPSQTNEIRWSLTSLDLTRASQGGGILVEVVLENPLLEAGEAAGRLIFSVSLEAHSGDLSRLDLAKTASLRTSNGLVVTEGFSWRYTSKSSHHPQGELALPLKTPSGGRVIGSNTQWVTLELKNVGKVPVRSFTWEGHYLKAIDKSREKWLALVPNAMDGTVSVVDLQAAKVIDTLPVQEDLSHGIAATSSGNLLFLGSMKADRLMAIDSRTRKIVESATLKGPAHGLDITPDERFVFVVGGSGEADGRDHVTRLSVKSGLAKLEVGAKPGSSPSHVEFSPDSRLAYVTNLLSDTVSVYDVNTLKLVGTIRTGDGPNEARVSPDGERLYVANWESDDITVVDTRSLKPVASIPSGKGTHGVAVSADGKQVWTANRKSGDLSVIDAGSLKLIRSIPLGEWPNHLAFTPDGRLVVVTDGRANQFVVVDALSYKILARVALGKEPHEISFASAEEFPRQP